MVCGARIAGELFSEQARGGYDIFAQASHAVNGDVIVVQGDAAESFCIVYQGEVSVHCWRERSEVKLMLKERPCGSIARNKGELSPSGPSCRPRRRQRSRHHQRRGAGRRY